MNNMQSPSRIDQASEEARLAALQEEHAQVKGRVPSPNVGKRVLGFFLRGESFEDRKSRDLKIKSMQVETQEKRTQLSTQERAEIDIVNTISWSKYKLWETRFSDDQSGTRGLIFTEPRIERVDPAALGKTGSILFDAPVSAKSPLTPLIGERIHLEVAAEIPRGSDLSGYGAVLLSSENPEISLDINKDLLDDLSEGDLSVLASSIGDMCSAKAPHKWADPNPTSWVDNM